MIPLAQLGVLSGNIPELTPPFMGDLVLWHDAQQLGLGDDDPVTSWPDIASSTPNNNSGVSGRFASNVFGSYPAVRFGDFGAYPANAAGAWYQYNSGNPLGGLTDFLIALVVRYETLASTGEQASMLMGRLIGGDGYMGYELNTRLRAGLAGASYAASGPDLPAMYQTDRRVILRRQGSTLTCAVDGAIVAVSTDAGSATWDALGNYYTTGYNRAFIGMMGEVLGYARSCDDNDLGEVDSYLSTKWGI